MALYICLLLHGSLIFGRQMLALIVLLYTHRASKTKQQRENTRRKNIYYSMLYFFFIGSYNSLLILFVRIVCCDAVFPKKNIFFTSSFDSLGLSIVFGSFMCLRFLYKILFHRCCCCYCFVYFKRFNYLLPCTYVYHQTQRKRRVRDGRHIFSSTRLICDFLFEFLTFF